MARAPEQPIADAEDWVCWCRALSNERVQVGVGCRQLQARSRRRFQNDLRSVCLSGVHIEKSPLELLEVSDLELDQVAKPIVEPVDFDLGMVLPYPLFHSKIKTAIAFRP